MSDLLQCPFCGGKAALNGFKRTQFGGYFVECNICYANVGKNFCGDGEAGGTVEDHSFDTESEAIAAWNRRSVPEGFVMVPVEPTPEMLAAGSEGWYEATMGSMIRDMYKAMIEAAQEEGNGNH